MFMLKKIDLENVTSFDLSEEEKLQIVSFETICLEKYKNSSEYKINLNEEVGSLSSTKYGWQLQIDVQEAFLNTFLYRFIELPGEEKKYLAQYSISPVTKRLSEVAYRRWIQGRP